MSGCDSLRERMPDVVHGGAWTEDEAAHLAGCPDCAEEWRLVRAGAALHAGLIVDADRVAGAVVARLRAVEPAEPRRLPWRGALVGLAALAAGLLLVVSVPRRAPTEFAVAPDTGGIMILPELEALTQVELDSVAQSFQSAGSPGGALVPRLDQLTDGELAELLQSQGGNE
ncbi:MAG: hypothetical protein ACREL5_15220 [Gemmatimonadales bacterium]